MTLAFTTTRDPTSILTATLAILTVHRAVTARQQRLSLLAALFKEEAGYMPRRHQVNSLESYFTLGEKT